MVDGLPDAADMSRNCTSPQSPHAHGANERQRADFAA